MAATIRIVVETSGGVDAVKKDLSSLGSTAQSAGGGFSSLREVATGALREIGSLAVNALGQAASAVGGFLKDSIGAAGDFQSGMLEFQAVAGKGVDTAGLEQFKDLFISLGKELPVSTADVQKAAIELVKGGIDPATVSAGGLKQTIQFAAAAMGGDLVAAAEVSAKVVGGWADVTATAQEKADLLTHSTDLLTKAANASTVDVHDLALGLYNVQGTAKTMGLTLDETTTTLAELAPRFSNANTAGTSFRNMLIRLQPQTNSQTGMMIDLGLYTEETGSKFFDAQGKFVGVAKASEMLKTALVGLTDQQKTEALQTIFGNDAMNAAAALADMGADGYNNMTAALQNANGVSDNAALKQQGLNTAMDNFKGSIEALQITVGTALLPVLTDLFNNVLAPAVNTVTTFADALLSAQDPVGVLVDQVDKLSPTLGTLVAALGDFILSGGDLGVVIDDLSNGFDTNLGPAIFGTVAMFQSMFDTVMRVFGELQPYVIGAMDAIGSYVGAVTAQIVAFWQSHGAEIMAFVKETWDTVWDIISTVAKIVYTIIQQQFGAAAAFINAHGAQIQQFLSDAWTIISNVIRAALALIQGIVKATLAVMQGDWEGAWNAIRSMCETVTIALWNIIKGALDLIAGLFNTSLQGIMDVWAHNWDEIKNYVSNIDWSALGGQIIDGLVGGVIAAAHKLYDAVKGAIDGALGAGEEAADAHSPARAFMPLGRNMAAGMAVGMIKGAPLVAGASAAAVGAAAATVNHYTTNNLTFAPNYGGQPSERMDYRFAKSLAGVA